ncbi:putative mannose-1-phosphate guanylyltransferase/mannose-6-phosphate isomerase [Aeromicrobium marinum DSM 15272]|uniref:Mannose-1-phosphate guanylyltransferase/mannose-6-phosphate isomerase n=1 Tax=Aeromicrobium marinum DSM 15272 TaxID=585531 RepID=E2SEW5_9ACTN|nr:mannose-1-phosphate guanylyltransferase [Aeromicrobium marinum]EFQ82412.1 putative mannose-1-phosphate guanylyltransferase/mannose-6-phosphate isomerase [Aeromicrobium marinum DSM 15272]
MTDAATSLHDFHAIVPAGGAGTRLWPLSRQARPKFLLDLTGSGRTLLQSTWDRLEPLVGAERIHVVTGVAHAGAVHEQLPDLTRLLVEPSPRESMPAIGLAAAVIAHRDPDAIIGSFAADHVIQDDAAFADAVRQAVAAARRGLVATIGIAPTEPSTAFGYIEAGEPLGIDGGPDVRTIVRFVEKPDAETAAGYVADPAFSWNAGMFVVRAQVLLDHLARLQPGLHAGLMRIAAGWDTSDRDDVMAGVWPSLTRIAIDHAVAEPVSLEGGMAVVPGRFGWNDIGDFAALTDIGATSTPGTVWVDADGLVVAADGTQVAVVGLRGVVVARTADALLVTTREYAQRVKEVPAALAAAGRADLQ